MKICMICLCLGDVDKKPLIGGQENSVIRLSKALYDRGHEIIIITTLSLYSSSVQAKIIDLEWGKIFPLSISGSYGSLSYGSEFMLKALYKMKKLHNKEKFDIIHGHSGYPILGSITGIGGKIFGIPSVHSLYCPVQTPFYKILLSQFYFSQIDVIISLSKNTKTSLRKIGIPDEKIKIVPPAIDLSTFNQFTSGKRVREDLNLKSNPLLLYVGDLTKTRGLHVLIEALSMIIEEFPNVKLLLAVNIPIKKYETKKFEIKEKISSLGLDDNVIPLGIVNNMPEIMAASNVFIAPYTDIEGIADYPVSMLEAMAVGKPVIASKVGGIPEILTHQKNGLLVRHNDPVELANAIVYMLNNKEEARKMRLKGAKLVSEKFKTEVIVDRLEKIYEVVISNYSGNRRC